MTSVSSTLQSADYGMLRIIITERRDGKGQWVGDFTVEVDFMGRCMQVRYFAMVPVITVFGREESRDQCGDCWLSIKRLSLEFEHGYYVGFEVVLVQDILKLQIMSAYILGQIQSS